MKSVKKLLKKGANEIMPDEQLKNSIKQQLGFYSPSYVETKTKKSFKFSYALGIIVLLVASILCAILLTPDKKPATALSKSYISLDVNPSIQIIIDENDEIAQVIPCNKDAVAVLYGKKFSKDTEKAFVEIMELLYKYGYLYDDAIVSVRAINDDSDKENYLYEIINKTLNGFSANKKLKMNINNGNKGGNNPYRVSESKFSLIKEIAENYGYDVEDLLEISPEELYKISRKYDKVEIDTAFEEIDKYFNNHNQYLKDKYLDKINVYQNLLFTVDRIKQDSKKGKEIHSLIENYNKECPESMEIDTSLKGKKFTARLDQIIKHYENIIDYLEDEYEDEVESIIDSFLKEKGVEIDDDDDYDIDDDDEYDD